MMFGLLSSLFSTQPPPPASVYRVDRLPPPGSGLTSLERSEGMLLLNGETLSYLPTKAYPAGSEDADPDYSPNDEFINTGNIIALYAGESPSAGPYLALRLPGGEHCCFIFNDMQAVKKLLSRLEGKAHKLCLIQKAWESDTISVMAELYARSPADFQKHNSHCPGTLSVQQEGLLFVCSGHIKAGDDPLPLPSERALFAYSDIAELSLYMAKARVWLEVALRDGQVLYYDISPFLWAVRGFAEALDKRLPQRCLEVDYGNGIVEDDWDDGFPGPASGKASPEKPKPGKQKSGKAEGVKPQAPAKAKPTAPVETRPTAPAEAKPAAAPAPKAEKVCKFCGCHYPADEEFCPECGAIETAES